MMYQLCHISLLIALLNLIFLRNVRNLLGSNPIIQEKIVGAYLSVLLFGDFFHISISFWASGDTRWDVEKWSFMLWAIVVTGLSLLVPRLSWFLGIGRYVHKRDGAARKESTPVES